jgi:hypothetical protein
MRFSERKRLLREKFVWGHSSNMRHFEDQETFFSVRSSERELYTRICKAPWLYKETLEIRGPR